MLQAHSHQKKKKNHPTQISKRKALTCWHFKLKNGQAIVQKDNNMNHNVVSST